MEPDTMAHFQQAYQHQEFRQHDILGYLKWCAESILSQRKGEMKKLLCAISSSLWWILSNAATFLQIFCFPENTFGGANAGRTSEWNYKRDEFWVTAPINLGQRLHPSCTNPSNAWQIVTVKADAKENSSFPYFKITPLTIHTLSAQYLWIPSSQLIPH